ncbi:MAG: PEGA domain-containing protein [bacterium]
MRLHLICSALTLAAGLIGAGCASHAMKPQQSYDKLRPVGVLPQESVEPTLIVEINNVKGEAQSRKNSAALFINDLKVLPNSEKSSGRYDYVYELALASGIYKIRAVYHAQASWREEDFEITTHDGQVRIYPNYRTRLAVTLDKKPDGTLKQKKNYFFEMPQSMLAPLSPALSESPAANKRVATPIVTGARVESQSIPLVPQEQNQQAASSTPRRATAADSWQQQNMHGTPEPAIAPALEPEGNQRNGKIALQINTTPSHAEVIVDDKYLGQSPLVTYVDRGEDHVIQLSKEGYAGIIKLINRRELEEQKVYFLVEKLEAQK